MKQRIIAGAYGWRRKHWSGAFYPEDLPVEDGDDWRLGYYSNEFNTVLVPADYWQAEQVIDCEDWLGSVHDEFRFFVECHPCMLDTGSLVDLSEGLKTLAPQLAGLVLLNAGQQAVDAAKKTFSELADGLQCDLFVNDPNPSQQGIWWPDEFGAGTPGGSKSLSFAFVEDDLSDLRKARAMVEPFAVQLSDKEACIIVGHPQLQAGDLSKFQAMLEIMGY